MKKISVPTSWLPIFFACVMMKCATLLLPVPSGFTS